MIQPLPRNPVVDGAGEGARHVLVEGKLDAVEAIADRKGRAPAVEHLGCERADIAPRPRARRSEVGARGDRSVGRIGDTVEALDAAIGHLVTPERLEVGEQGVDARHRRVHIAIDRFHRSAHGAGYLARARQPYNARGTTPPDLRERRGGYSFKGGARKKPEPAPPPKAGEGKNHSGSWGSGPRWRLAPGARCGTWLKVQCTRLISRAWP